MQLRRLGGWSARVGVLTPTGVGGAITRASDHVLLQYNPYMYGRWGVSPWLVREFMRLRRSRGTGRMAIMVHEPYVPFNGVRFGVLYGPQRVQLRLLKECTDERFAATTAWAHKVGASTVVLPVGSNIPDRRGVRSEARSALGLADTDFVVTAFGTDHPSRMPAWIAAAVNGIDIAVAERCVFLNLGAGAPEITTTMETIRPDILVPEVLAARIAASDLMLAPFVDGVSTRRGSVMAAFQHAVPVVTTAGVRTGPELLNYPDAWAATDVREGRDAFVSIATRLATDSDVRAWTGKSGRRLYERSFAWDRTAATLTSRLAATSA